MKNKLLISIGILIVACFGLWAINYYVYSWTSNISIFQCSEKYLGIVDISKSSKGERFDEFLDLNKMADALKADPKYFVKLNQNFRLLLQRNFNDKVYILSFENDNVSKTTNFNFSGGYLSENEECSAPNYWILQNGYQLVDDLPYN